IKGLMYALLCCLLLLSVALICLNANGVYAAPQDYATEINETELEEEASTYELANLTLSINGGDGKVWATVRNDLAWFAPKVVVIVLLYSSDTYCESYLDMRMESSNEIGDLNMGKTIMTEAPTGGVEKYWIARMRYKINSGDWKSKDTGVCRIGPSGEFLGYV
ncbi:MAG: hypothetical protein K2G26_05090, partial [Clostridia bacterium]|nr:hypothetical protein [Clostridia bacterium]